LSKKWFFPAKKLMVFVKKVIFFVSELIIYYTKNNVFCQGIDLLPSYYWARKSRLGTLTVS
jgi:hypothetical protein